MREQIWTMYAKRADFFGIAKKYNIDPVIARVIRNRDIVGDENIEQYLHGDLKSLYSPALMKDMDKGCRIMLDKIKAGKHIRIISDYDVDGVTSNYILYRGLNKVIDRLSSVSLLDYDIPHRIYDGYGINVRLIDKAYSDGVDTIITCDNGIAAFAAVEHAKELGMTIIVTDHHEIPYDNMPDGSRSYRIVPADAVIDHKQSDCSYPFKELCGAGVAYKFIQMMYELSGIPQEYCYDFLEYLGIATVCDVMELTGENRIFVKEALKRLPQSSNYGLAALIRNANLEGKAISAFHLGFIIGPCINASGRLDEAVTSLKFLLEEDSYKAEARAVELVNINNERKSMTADGTERAIELVDEKDKVLVIYLADLHESLAGIVAGRVREQFYRPVLVFTDGEEPGIIKGSGRSIEGYDMYGELNKCSRLLTKFGGHEMAAGFSARKENLEILKTTLNENCTLTEKELTPKLYIDVPMPLSYVNMELTRQLSLLEPFGKGNEKPVFAQSGVRLLRATVMGKNKNVLKCLFEKEPGKNIEGIYFQPEQFISDIKQWFGEDECVRMLKGAPISCMLDVAYYPDINEYAGRAKLQIKILEYRKHED